MPAPTDTTELTQDDTRAAYTGVAIYDGRQWASLCPEVDIASVGGDADDAIRNLIVAVREALQFAADEGLDQGGPAPDDELRRFMISSQAPFSICRFYI